MIFLIWLVLLVVAAALILLFPALRGSQVYRENAGSRLVSCPENQQTAVVSLDARHAASSSMVGRVDLRIANCTRWPERSACGQGCLPQALHAASPPAESKTPPKRIYHLPILLAAFAAWCLGAIWHAQYLFRPRWMDALGLTQAQMKQLVWWVPPHVLTAAVCLLFAYGVGWLLAVSHRRGVLPGLLAAVVLGAAVAAASWFSLAGVPRDLLMIEAGYALLAVLIVGAIVGGFYGRLVLRPQ